jgi:hypothetical protein
MTAPLTPVERRASRTAAVLTVVAAVFGLLSAVLGYMTVSANRDKALAADAAQGLSNQLAEAQRQNEILRRDDSALAQPSPTASAVPDDVTPGPTVSSESAPPAADEVRWQGKVRITDNIDLDAEPPRSTLDNDIYAEDGPALGSRPGVHVAPWDDSATPARDECYTRAVTQSYDDNQVIVKKLKVDARYCIWTRGGHTALLTVKEPDGDAFFADVLVWE